MNCLPSKPELKRLGYAAGPRTTCFSVGDFAQGGESACKTVLTQESTLKTRFTTGPIAFAYTRNKKHLCFLLTGSPCTRVPSRHRPTPSPAPAHHQPPNLMAFSPIDEPKASRRIPGQAGIFIFFVHPPPKQAGCDLAAAGKFKKIRFRSP